MLRITAAFDLKSLSQSFALTVDLQVMFCDGHEQDLHSLFEVYLILFVLPTIDVFWQQV